MHEHDCHELELCEHKLKYCVACKAVYCKICKREWERKTYFSVSDPINIAGTYPPPITTSASYKVVDHSLPHLEKVA